MTTQADLLTILAGLVALFVGIIGLLDGIFENAIQTGKWMSNNWTPFHSQNTPKILPLVVFGIATALA
jgi:hypothetical protein